MEKIKQKGKVFVVVAPSGTGKSTLVKALREEVKDLAWSVSYTSREAREGEVHGKDYFFVKENEFKRLITEDVFLEWALVHGQYKGTSKRFIEQELAQGRFLLLDLDIQGCDAIKKIFQDQAVIIFVEPPSVEELERRLRARGTEKEEDIIKRLQNAKKELSRRNDYDYLMVNDNIERASAQLIQIIQREMGLV